MASKDEMLARLRVVEKQIIGFKQSLKKQEDPVVRSQLKPLREEAHQLRQKLAEIGVTGQVLGRAS